MISKKKKKKKVFAKIQSEFSAEIQNSNVFSAQKIFFRESNYPIKNAFWDSFLRRFESQGFEILLCTTLGVIKIFYYPHSHRPRTLTLSRNHFVTRSLVTFNSRSVCCGQLIWLGINAANRRCKWNANTQSLVIDNVWLCSVQILFDLDCAMLHEHLHKCTVKDIVNAETWKQLIWRWEVVGAFCGWNPSSKTSKKIWSVKLYSLINCIFN